MTVHVAKVGPRTAVIATDIPSKQCQTNQCNRACGNRDSYAAPAWLRLRFPASYSAASQTTRWLPPSSRDRTGCNHFSIDRASGSKPKGGFTTSIPHPRMPSP